MINNLYKLEETFEKLKKNELFIITTLPLILSGFLLYQYVYKPDTKIFKKKEKKIKSLKSQISNLKNQNMIISTNNIAIINLIKQIKEYNKKIEKLSLNIKRNIAILKNNNIFKIDWVKIMNDLNNNLKINNLKLVNLSVYLGNNNEVITLNCHDKKKCFKKEDETYKIIKEINSNLNNKLLLLMPKYYYYIEIETPKNIFPLLSFINNLFNDSKMKQIYMIKYEKKELKNKNQQTKHKGTIQVGNKIGLLLIYFDIKK